MYVRWSIFCFVSKKIFFSASTSPRRISTQKSWRTCAEKGTTGCFVSATGQPTSCFSRARTTRQAGTWTRKLPHSLLVSEFSCSFYKRESKVFILFVRLSRSAHHSPEVGGGAGGRGLVLGGAGVRHDGLLVQGAAAEVHEEEEAEGGEPKEEE